MNKTNVKEKSINKFNTFLGWVVSLIVILIGLILTINSLLKGIIFLLIGLLINPKIGEVINNKFNIKKARMIAIILLIVVIIWVFSAYKTENQSASIGQIDEPISDLTACDFIPSKEIIPTEFKLGPIKEENNTCMQTYIQNSPWLTKFNIKIHKFNTKSDAGKKYGELIEIEKSRRGYTELKTVTDQCFAIHRELLEYSEVKLYCNWGYLLYEETVYDIELFDSDILLRKIPQNVANKLS